MNSNAILVKMWDCQCCVPCGRTFSGQMLNVSGIFLLLTVYAPFCLMP